MAEEISLNREGDHNIVSLYSTNNEDGLQWRLLSIVEGRIMLDGGINGLQTELQVDGQGRIQLDELNLV